MIISELRPLIERIEAEQRGSRALVAVVGAPGSGKTTLASALHEALPRATTVVVPMDGYHLDDDVLNAQGTRDVKGAPHTFDLGGLRSTLERIAADNGPVYVPRFERDHEFSRAAAIEVAPAHRCVLVEGNYLMLDEPGWSELADLYTLSVFLDIPRPVLHKRLMKRWHDLSIPEAEARRRVEENDLPNGDRVTAGSRRADIVFRPAESHL